MSDTMLTCPKCHGAMRTYERSGVTVDQCGECRGIFLDRGELDRLIDAERDWHAGSEAPQRDNHRDDYRDDRYEHDRRHYDDDRRHDNDRRYEHGGYPRKRKKSFLDELFD